MRIAFLSQMGFSGKVPRTHDNMRVEFAQMCALNADHFPLYDLHPNRNQVPNLANPNLTRKTGSLPKQL